MKLRVGSRASTLALTQTKTVVAALSSSITAEIIEIKTSGDKKQGTDAARTGDKKDWVLELELALLGGSIDLAVHSAKDIPGNIEPGTAILPVLTRATPNDIFVGRRLGDNKRILFSELKPGDKIGTSSLRRKSSLLSLNLGLVPVDHRGNVPTRIKKLDESTDLAGIILAAAGVERLSALVPTDYELIAFSQMLPSMNQGILAVQFRSDDEKVRAVAERLSNRTLQGVFFAERACAETLQGDCNSAISIFCEGDQILTLSAKVFSHDGHIALSATEQGPTEDSRLLGKLVGEKLISAGALQVLRG